MKSARRIEKEQRWEEICDKCGLCCYQKEYRGAGMVINTNRPCAYFSVETGLCMVYENRFKVCSDCRKVTLFRAGFSSLLPESCAYVRRYRRLKALIPTARVRDRRVPR